MTVPIGGISLPSFVPPIGGLGAAGGTAGVGSAPPAPTAGGDAFSAVLAQSVDRLQGLQSSADTLATQAATGDLKDVHDYMIASNEAALATEMVVTIKNKAVDAFNEIMRMQL